ncbi:prolyl oligopeptidase family serine peptidase [Pimelobacter simplex]|uniref:prolyl oligopeptidase n=1 Tax=Nocardioides simplex TaxID=2045 RepID=A0A0A1DT86_NOCSI|nr:prolyl oligopeptidase family serine peptidase [Pimelobacter simplex]AIY18620.2 Prolyl endopeptidase [Pimelobacter simplex]MCG8153190.1 prolyl oligopeptidase family serine peptidase [Pimelobacter simplex]SFM31683.1 prolyl oligopeptidase [Pimelobacter simplex]
MTYPATRRGDVVDVLHGQPIADPYRWLEDPDSPETVAWVDRQNAYTEGLLAALPERAWFRARLAEALGQPRAGCPVKAGGRYLVTRNDGSQKQDSWWLADSLDELRSGGRLVLDPDSWSADGTTSVQAVSVSRDGRLLAAVVSEGGSDWGEIRLHDLDRDEPLPDAPIQTKHFAPVWLPDHASYVYAAPQRERTMTGTDAEESGPMRVLRHVLGTPESADEVLVDLPSLPRVLFESVQVSHDERWLLVTFADGTEQRTRVWAHPLTTAAGRTAIAAPRKVVDDAVARFEVVRVDGDVLICTTDLDADRGRVVAIDLDAADPAPVPLPRTLIAETADQLIGVLAPGDELLAVRLVDAQPCFDRYSLSGTHLGRLAAAAGALPPYGGLWADPTSADFFLGISTVTQPLLALRGTAGSDDLEPLDDLVPPGGAYDPPAVTVSRVRAASKDGTEVPYFHVRRADQDPAAAVPTLVYGYGGFGIPVGADYMEIYPAWLEAGGAIAIANLRGGGEYGTAWYEAGRREHKQNVFDDFIAVGEHLLASGAADHLVLHGGSNGGLLVAAVLTQRPDLATVVLPAVGVMDLLRFHLFTFGAAWISDYGDPDDPDDFAVALAYSPLHNVRPASYPATMIVTGDHDDRVVPSHSHKLTATLQRAQRGPAPIVTRVERAAGHGAGKATSQVVAETADMLAFAAHHVGLVPG